MLHGPSCRRSMHAAQSICRCNMSGGQRLTSTLAPQELELWLSLDKDHPTAASPEDRAGLALRCLAPMLLPPHLRAATTAALLRARPGLLAALRALQVHVPARPPSAAEASPKKPTSARCAYRAMAWLPGWVLRATTVAPHVTGPGLLRQPRSCKCACQRGF